MRATPKVGKGDLRAAALLILAEQPVNGYQLIQAISERSQGSWRPSPGSVYPALHQLESEDLVQSVPSGSRREYDLTPAGRTYVEEHWEELVQVWQSVTGSVDNRIVTLRTLCEQVNGAVLHIMRDGNERRVGDAVQLLTELRRQLYRLLSEDEPQD